MSNIQNKYKKLTDIEHVLKRPSMYIGSIKPHEIDGYTYDGNEIKFEHIVYNPGFLKLFDEILSNSIDEHKRNKKLNTIKVNIDLDDSVISIWDNGGIPVIKHTEYDEYIPEMIFSNLKSGSNFDDTEQRIVAGTNGVGSTITNIYSTEFIVETADGKNKFYQKYTDNMQKRTKVKITKTNRSYTKITYKPDLKRFGMDSIDETSFKLLYKRCLDAAACNKGLRIEFEYTRNGKTTKDTLAFKSFKEYIRMYTSDFYYEESEHWQIAFAYSDKGYSNVSFVNSVNTTDGGTHVEYISKQLIDKLRTLISKKYKVDPRPSDIRNHLTVFINSTVHNSSFSSQTKEKLITEPRDFGTSHTIKDSTVKSVFKSEIVLSLLDYLEKKKQAEERAQLRKLNKNLSNSKVIKLIDANNRTNRAKCSLSIFEGLSAVSAFRKFRDSSTQGAFPLKGKFLNVSELSNSKVIQNSEVKDLMASIGLKLGESPNNLRYGKIYIYTDADPDGNHIAATLMNFFYKYWPEMFDMGMIYKVMTPIVVAKKGNTIKSFYTMEDYNNWHNKSNINLKSWDIQYKKGLASLTDDEYEEIIRNPYAIKIVKDKESKTNLNAWFGKDSLLRKNKIVS